MNRAALAALTLGYADGLHEVGLAVHEAASVPDAPPYGRGLIARWGVATVVNRRRVASAGPVTNIPRDGILPPASIGTVVGWGFPGRFLELGTVDTAAQPFLTPAMGSVTGGAGAVVAAKIEQHLAKVR